MAIANELVPAFAGPEQEGALLCLNVELGVSPQNERMTLQLISGRHKALDVGGRQDASVALQDVIEVTGRNKALAFDFILLNTRLYYTFERNKNKK